EITPIIDLRKKLNIPGHYGEDSERDKEMLVMVVEIDGVPVGILVDGVSDVIQIPKENIEKVDGVGNNMGVDYIEGIGKIDNRLIIILNINKLIKPQEGF
ncbi:MAG TPA: chemotaxis protein CheW, partial [Methanothermococcus okinawensis]|nr:chemotaxis protein CheW [Methanothermococcus okinawensis]